MNTPPKFERQLSDWLEDGPADAPDAILDSVLAAVPSTPQRRAASRVPWRATSVQGFFRGLSQVAAVLVIAAFALIVIPRLVPGRVGSPPSVTPEVPSPSLAVGGSSPSPSPSLPVSPAPTSSPSTAGAAQPCQGNDLAAEVTDWQGAAGSRFGTIQVQNMGTTACLVSGTPGLQLADGKDHVFLDSATLGEPASESPAEPVFTLGTGGDDRLFLVAGLNNYCGAPPAAPVSLDMVLPAGLGSVVATTRDGVVLSMPPCNGPGAPTVLHVQLPWSTTAP